MSETFTSASAMRRGVPHWRVTVWANGKPLAFRDFLHKPLADAWQQRMQDANRVLRYGVVFVKIVGYNLPQETQA